MSPRFTHCLVVLALSLACLAGGQAQQDSKKRTAIDLAGQAFDEEVARAKNAYDEALQRAGKKLFSAYDVAIAAAMKRGGGESLDFANQLNDEKKAKAALIEGGEPPKEPAKSELIKKKGEATKKRGAATDRLPWVGVWSIKYCPNKTARTYLIGPSGQVEFEGKILSLTPAGDSLLLDFGDKLERLTFTGNRVFVEHFSPKSAFANNNPDQIGIGELAKSN